MTEIEALFAKRDAQWSAFRKKRDRLNRRFHIIIGTVITIITVVTIGAL